MATSLERRHGVKIGLEHLRRHAVARSLFPPTSLGRAIRRLGFVQADPIRVPARAQDLVLSADDEVLVGERRP